MISVLRDLYYKVYGEIFSFERIDDRIKLQKAIYLLNNMGVSIGDYSFVWDVRGPYSFSLDYDARNISDCKDSVIPRFSEIVEVGIARLRDIILKKDKYSDTYWVECIASIHYLENVMRVERKKVLNELQELKPYLCNRDENEKALKVASRLEIVS